MMRNNKRITEFLEQEGLKLSGPLVRKEDESSAFYAFVEVSRNDKGHQQPSNMRLKEISNALAEMEASVDFILNDISNRDLETGLRATLLHAFPDFVRNSFLRTSEAGASVWIVPKTAAINDILPDVKERIAQFLALMDVQLAETKLTTDENFPSRTAILKELRIIAPASREALSERLAAKGFVKPPADYLNRHLDALRKGGHVVRRKDAKFCLTANALKILGTVKRRKSPDISRLLDLARRGDV